MVHKDDRVRHPGLPDWGIGRVLEEPRDGKAKVFFVGSGERVISLASAPLAILRGEEAEDPLLENLSLDDAGHVVPHRSLKDSVALFLREYEGGFFGETFAGNERGYKEKARDLCRSLLARERLADLLKEGPATDVCRDAMKVVDETNLIFPNEKMALKDGLKRPGAAASFARALFELLHGSDPQKTRFGRFVDVLSELGAAKWTIATYFPFFLSPETEIFVKPTVTQSAARICAYEIGYRPDLDWHVYERIRAFADDLRDGIAHLRPRDMIDVQSFMWCISPNRDETRARKAVEKQAKGAE